jgi:hypothetical protein
MPNIPRNDLGGWRDLVAFLAILTTGILLITLGHLTSSALTTVCAALAGVYVAWRHRRS